MKELVELSSNFMLIPDLASPPAMIPMVELVLICSEADYIRDPDSKEILRTRGVSHFRVACSPKAMRNVAKALMELADQAETVERAVNAMLGDSAAKLGVQAGSGA